jgi:hypothetical protein
MESDESIQGKSFATVLDSTRDRDGRDEMNLAEYPIALLADRQPKDVKTLVYHDRDEMLTITGSDLLGLPTALDVDVIVALLKLTKEKNGFKETVVPFTRYELIEILNWPDRGYYYKRLAESLNRWVGVTLIYKKSWWDNETKTKGNRTIHILDSVTIIEQQERRSLQSRQIELPFSQVRWGTEFFRSLQANNLKKLDLELYFSLESSISKQLYRFLDKRFYKKAEWHFDLRALACERVGMSRSYETWKLKQKLQPAIDELTKVGFLKSMPPKQRFTQAGRGNWNVWFVRGREAKDDESTEPDCESITQQTANERSLSELAGELVSRGVTPKTARELVATYSEDRIRTQLERVDWQEQGGKKKIADRGAFLTAAIRDDYAPPKGFESKAAKAKQHHAAAEAAKQERADAVRRQRKRLETERRSAEVSAKVNAYWESLTPAELELLETEALAAASPEILSTLHATPAIRRCLIREHIKLKLGLEGEPPPENALSTGQICV